MEWDDGDHGHKTVAAPALGTCRSAFSQGSKSPILGNVTSRRNSQLAVKPLLFLNPISGKTVSTAQLLNTRPQPRFLKHMHSRDPPLLMPSITVVRNMLRRPRQRMVPHVLHVRSAYKQLRIAIPRLPSVRSGVNVGEGGRVFGVDADERISDAPGASEVGQVRGGIGGGDGQGTWRRR